MQAITVDLRNAPHRRWLLTALQREQARELMSLYKADLGLRPDIGEVLLSSARDHVREDHWAEMESLAQQLDIPLCDAVLCNFYYDATKIVLDNMFGCTAFAIETPTGILHARNLDWWTEHSALSRCTTVCNFVGAPAGDFTTIGWPGFIGTFSGVAPGRFAVTLNAVLSLDPPQPAVPVELLLRTVLEQARSFNQAREILSRTPLPCDCLLLLTGTLSGEIVVIERAPARYAFRGPKNGNVAVTNGYLQLEADIGSAPSSLFASTCQRYYRVEALIRNHLPDSVQHCFHYLSDPEVQMNMTVQQMVFRAATGEYWLNANLGANA